MFDAVRPAPADPILGLSEAFRSDPRPEKVNLTVGVYQDEEGRTPILATVKEAERRLLDAETTKAYEPIDGSPSFGGRVRELLFGEDAAMHGRAVTAQCPGGTAALRIAGEVLRRNHGTPTVWLTQPTWANHVPVFSAAGLETATYPYADIPSGRLAFDAMLKTLRQVSPGDVVVLHGCCHNPTGIDPTPDQWFRIGQTLAERGALPLVDFAYQGFARGVREDATSIHRLAAACDEMMVCSSFSKNLGLYNERVGALTVVASRGDAAAAVLSHLKKIIRANYSNPPAHGARIACAILEDADLRERWEAEVAEMRNRLKRLRASFAEKLEAAGAGDHRFITEQNGLFSFSGLTQEQVHKLREESIYIVDSGRINVAGLNDHNIDRVAEAIARVVTGG